MGWDYRVVKSLDEKGPIYGVCEVVYDENNGTPSAMSREGVSPHGQGREEFEEDCRRWTAAFLKPILVAADGKFTGTVEEPVHPFQDRFLPTLMELIAESERQADVSWEKDFIQQTKKSKTPAPKKPSPGSGASS
jgi:hypothetical protein